MCLFHINFSVIITTVDRGDVESDDSEEDNPVNNPANKFNSKAPSNTG